MVNAHIHSKNYLTIFTSNKNYHPKNEKSKGLGMIVLQREILST